MTAQRALHQNRVLFHPLCADHADSSSPQLRPRIAVMLSGSGRTLLNLLDTIARGELNAQIVCVMASRSCLGADRATERGLPVKIIPSQIPADTLEQLLTKERIDWVVLAGYLKFVEVPAAYTGRIVNIHPALLPRHGGPGMFGHRVHEAVLAAGENESGCTVHLCDNQYDHGPIVLQRSCPVLPSDTADTLAARVFKQECIAYPQALKQLFNQHPHHDLHQQEPLA